jgi:hypothetical protein
MEEERSPGLDVVRFSGGAPLDKETQMDTESRLGHEVGARECGDTEHLRAPRRRGSCVRARCAARGGNAVDYSYDDLTVAQTAGTRFTDFNRERVSICADYY